MLNCACYELMEVQAAIAVQINIFEYLIPFDLLTFLFESESLNFLCSFHEFVFC